MVSPFILKASMIKLAKTAGVIVSVLLNLNIIQKIQKFNCSLHTECGKFSNADKPGRMLEGFTASRNTRS
jgi:hypothetical protein